MKKILFGVVLAGVLALPAMAADMPVKAPAVVAPVTTAYNWTGLYVGAHFGGAWGKSRWDGFPTLFGLIGPFGKDLDLNGSIAGGQLGINYQINALVLGVQGDFGSAVVRGDSTCNALLAPPLLGALTRCRTGTEWLASLTGRVGMAWDRSLVYAKGGEAWMSTLYGFGRGEVFAQSVFPMFQKRDTRTGWTIGVGFEQAFSRRVSGFVEYDFYDFGTKTINVLEEAYQLEPMRIGQKINVVKAGLNLQIAGLGGQSSFAAASKDLSRFNWAGFYVGAHIGHGWDYDRPLPNFTGIQDRTSQSFSQGQTQGGVNYQLETDYVQLFNGLQAQHQGWFPGIQGGYDYQFSNGIVAGLIGDFSFRGVDASSHADWIRSSTANLYTYYTDATFSTVTGFENIVNSDGGYLNVNGRLNYFATIRGRLGFAWDQFLPYVTGGLAWGENRVTAQGKASVDTFDATYDSNFVPTGVTHIVNYSTELNASQSKIHVGWALGGGVEYALNPRWSVGAEYLYVDLGNRDYTFTWTGGEVSTVSLGQHFHTVRAMLNYRL